MGLKKRVKKVNHYYRHNRETIGELMEQGNPEACGFYGALTAALTFRNPKTVTHAEIMLVELDAWIEGK